jgi:hypothetical protein
VSQAGGEVGFPAMRENEKSQKERKARRISIFGEFDIWIAIK